MLAGERVILSEATLDAIVLGDNGRSDVASFFNENRLGVLDAYVCWIGKENEPVCIRRNIYGHGFAVV